MISHKPLLIIKTGNTIPTLVAQGVDFEDWFQTGCGLNPDQCQTVSLFLGEPLPELSAVAGIIVTGSPAYVTDLEPWNHVGARYLLRAHETSMPILGVCYGHQLLAWAFGGEVGYHPKGREIGTAMIRLNQAGQRDRLFAGLPEIFPAQTSHQQSVLELPPQAVLLAGNDFDPNHAFRLGDSTWGVQFHPEFTASTTRAYIQERRAELAEEGLDTRMLIRQIQDSPAAASLLPRFVDLLN